MCDGIDSVHIEAMRQAYGELRAAALQLLACGDGSHVPASALERLRHACTPDPEAFVAEPRPMHRMVLRLPH